MYRPYMGCIPYIQGVACIYGLHAGWVGNTGLYRAKYRVYIGIYRYRAHIRYMGPVPVYIGKYRPCSPYTRCIRAAGPV